MMSEILQKVTEVFDNLTPSQKTVANFVIENINNIAFITLDDLAQKIGVSTTTVIRFARMLGYSGYSDMQMDIQSHIKGKVSLPERLSDAAHSAAKCNQLLIDTFNKNLSNINETLVNLSEEDLEEAISTIVSGKTIYVLGQRSSFALSHYMASRLAQIKKNVKLIQAIGMIYPEEIVSAEAGDVCIAYMFPRYSKIVANILLWLKKNGVKIILFTSPGYSYIETYGNIILPCSVKGISFKNSFVAPMCLSDYLVASIAFEDYTNAMNILSKTEDILSQGYYLGL